MSAYYITGITYLYNEIAVLSEKKAHVIPALNAHLVHGWISDVTCVISNENELYMQLTAVSQHPGLELSQMLPSALIVKARV